MTSFEPSELTCPQDEVCKDANVGALVTLQDGV